MADQRISPSRVPDGLGKSLLAWAISPPNAEKPMDRLEAMSILVTAVETGSFSAASRKLGVPLPTVSRKVSELEEHLKSRLLVRSTRRLSLTDAGAAYIAACRRILEQVDDAEAQAAGEYSA